jgi:hypothetical protein
VAEQQELREYRQGDIVRLTVELQDESGLQTATTWARLEGEHAENKIVPEVKLTGWPEGYPSRAEVVLTAELGQEPPGVYECSVIVGENGHHALSRHEIHPPRRFRIVEHPNDVREGPEILSVGEFW